MTKRKPEAPQAEAQEPIGDPPPEEPPQTEPEAQPPAEEPTDPEPETDPGEGEEEFDAAPPSAEAERPAVPEPGPLTKLQDAVRELFDHDQLSEIRLALGARREDLKKHEKKGVELGVSEPDARFKLEILDGTSTKFGLIRIFSAVQATETRDMFYDREKPNGRPDAKGPSVEEQQFTFRTVDGRDITCTGAQLRLAHILMDIRSLRFAGVLPEQVEVAFREMGYAHLIEDAQPATDPIDSEAAAGAEEQEGPEGAGHEADQGRELAAASGISA